jgi:hypothetical protein
LLRERKDYPRLITPAAPSIWPALNEPDYKFKKDTGEYHARLRISPDDLPAWQPVVDAAQAILDEAFEAKKAELTREKKGALLKELNKAEAIIKPEIDPETGDETGFYIFRASMNARVDIKNGPRAGQSFDKKPDIFNAKGQSLKNPPKIGGGSELKLGVVPMDYWMAKDKTVGVRFELEGAQILKLIQGGARTADFYGFTAEDGDDIEDGDEPVKTGGFADESGDDGGDF